MVYLITGHVTRANARVVCLVKPSSGGVLLMAMIFKFLDGGYYTMDG